MKKAFKLAAWLVMSCAARLPAEIVTVHPPVTTHHQIRIAGKTLAYTATAGFLPLIDPQGSVRGEIFYTAYRLDQNAAALPRPLMFCWNGGPGSNSSQLHLGTIGPRRAVGPEEQKGTKEPFILVDNTKTWLQFSDLVMVDPIGTGYSFATSKEFQKQFFTSDGDALSIAEFIRVYRQRFRAEKSSLYLAGESYGTYRAAGVASELAKHNVPVRGIILISCILNLETRPRVVTDAISLLPTLTAAGWAQGLLAPEFQGSFEHALAASEEFAQGEYARLLINGDAASKADQAKIANTLQSLTGVKADLWKAKRFQIPADDFATALLADKTHYVAHYDTRMQGTTEIGLSYDVAHDPSLMSNGIPNGVSGYLRDELGWETDAYYGSAFGGRWPDAYSMRGEWREWDEGEERSSPDRTMLLGDAMTKDAALRIMVASGYFDFSTPFFKTEYAFNHMGLNDEQHSRVQLHVYRGGHMIYMDGAARELLFEDVKRSVE